MPTQAQSFVQNMAEFLSSRVAEVDESAWISASASGDWTMSPSDVLKWRISPVLRGHATPSLPLAERLCLALRIGLPSLLLGVHHYRAPRLAGSAIDVAGLRKLLVRLGQDESLAERFAEFEYGPKAAEIWCQAMPPRQALEWIGLCVPYAKAQEHRKRLESPSLVAARQLRQFKYQELAVVRNVSDLVANDFVGVAWVVAGLSEDVALAWHDSRWDLLEAIGWISVGARPDDAKEWLSAGLCPADYANRDSVWLSNGFESPGAAKPWQNQGFAPAEAREWQSLGFRPERAKQWLRRGFDSETAFRWSNAGVSPAQAQEWAHTHLPPIDVSRWIELDVNAEAYGKIRASPAWQYRDPLEALSLWHQDGIVAVEANEWIRYGFTLREAREWKKAGASPLEALGAKQLRQSPEFWNSQHRGGYEPPRFDRYNSIEHGDDFPG